MDADDDQYSGMVAERKTTTEYSPYAQSDSESETYWSLASTSRGCSLAWRESSTDGIVPAGLRIRCRRRFSEVHQCHAANSMMGWWG
jgi:hypothetical protein